MATENEQDSNSAEDAPEGFWDQFGKFAAEKMGLFEEFTKTRNATPPPPANDGNNDNEDKTRQKKTTKSWFGSSE